jgi:hypothetical protein
MYKGHRERMGVSQIPAKKSSRQLRYFVIGSSNDKIPKMEIWNVPKLASE